MSETLRCRRHPPALVLSCLSFFLLRKNSSSLSCFVSFLTETRRLRRLSSSSPSSFSSSSLPSNRRLATVAPSSAMGPPSFPSSSSSSRLPPHSFSVLSTRPLVIDYGVLWNNPNLPFSSVFTDETPTFFLNTLYKQFLDRGDVLTNPVDGTLQQAAYALKKRPFLVTFDSPRALRLPITIWSRGFGIFSPPEIARELFSLSGIPLPTTQPLDLPYPLVDRLSRSNVSIGQSGPPHDNSSSSGGGGQQQQHQGVHTLQVSGPHASVQYSLASEKKTLIPLTPGIEKWLGACHGERYSLLQGDTKMDSSATQSCCAMHAEMQVRGRRWERERRKKKTRGRSRRRRRRKRLAASPLYKWQTCLPKEPGLRSPESVSFPLISHVYLYLRSWSSPT